MEKKFKHEKKDFGDRQPWWLFGPEEKHFFSPDLSDDFQILI